MGEGPKEGNEDDQKAGECEERLKELGLFSLGKEMAQEEHHDCILALKRQLQRGQRLSLHQEPCGEDSTGGSSSFLFIHTLPSPLPSLNVDNF